MNFIKTGFGVQKLSFWTPLFFIVGVSISLVACSGQESTTPVSADSQTERYFSETGFSVKDEFLPFFETYGGLESLGNPLSGEMEADGWRVQYFEYGRLEYHPENEAAYRVTVGWLGDLLNRRRPPIPPGSIPAAGEDNRRYFSETGHTLSGDFLRYFDMHGGSVRFGLPISEPFLEQGQLAQDFQSARFYWSVEKDEAVTLEHIGRTHYEQVIDPK